MGVVGRKRDGRKKRADNRQKTGGGGVLITRKNTNEETGTERQGYLFSLGLFGRMCTR